MAERLHRGGQGPQQEQEGAGLAERQRHAEGIQSQRAEQDPGQQPGRRQLHVDQRGEVADPLHPGAERFAEGRRRRLGALLYAGAGVLSGQQQVVGEFAIVR